MAFQIFSPFINRKPWAAALIALFVTPMGGMFYLGRGAMGLAYLLLLIVVVLISHPALEDGIVSVITLVAAVHCYLIAKKQAGLVPRQWFSRWHAIAILLMIPIGAGILWENFNMPSRSMLPNVKVGDHLYVSKYAYGYSRYSFPEDISAIDGRWFFTPPERGDIVVFKLPTDPKVDFIKRIVGLPNDRIQIKGGILHINGKPVDRVPAGEYSRIDPYTGDDVSVPQYKETLPNGVEYLILEETDNGLMDETPVYEVPPGHYFALGDNRDSSRDSRFLQDFGYVPAENLVGRLAIVYWNSEDNSLPFLD